MVAENSGRKPIKKRVFEIISIGYTGDFASRLFDVWTTIAILANLFIVIFETFDISVQFLRVLTVIETITVVSFTIEYVLRLWTSDYLYPELGRGSALVKYMTSFFGIIDLVSFLPFYLPVVFPAGIVAFRMLRVVRILRLFRINAYYDALNAIGDVLRRKKNQLISSVFIILILMLASSIFMYGLEHEAQPEMFKNAFSGIWWSVSTLLTVGYGDIYPITLAGRIFAIITTFLGVGLVAIPTGILSAGFVEEYSILKNATDYLINEDLRFVRINVDANHPWKDRRVSDLPLPPDLILAVIQRGEDTVIPTKNVKILEGDSLVLAAESHSEDAGITVKEMVLTDKHSWIGEKIRNLDISRLTLIVMIRRNGETIIPTGDTVLQEGDTVFVCSKSKIPDSTSITL